METLSTNELQAIAMTMQGIKYPDTGKKFILEVDYGIFFRKLSNKFQINSDAIKQKLENMQVEHPQQFNNLMKKMQEFWDTKPEEKDLIVRLSELKLI